MPEYEKNTLKQNSHFLKAINHIAVVDDNHSFYNCAIIMGVGIIPHWPLPYSQQRRCLCVKSCLESIEGLKTIYQHQPNSSQDTVSNYIQSCVNMTVCSIVYIRSDL